MELIRASDCVACLQNRCVDFGHFHTRKGEEKRKGRQECVILYNAIVVLNILAH